MKTCIATIGLVIAATTPTLAGPLNHEWVAADAKWLIHVDVEKLTDSSIGEMLLEHADLDDLDEFEEMTGVDPRKDIKSVTAYGATGELEEDAVAILVTNDAVDEAEARLAELREVDEIEVGGKKVYVYDDHGDRHYVHIRRGRGANRRIVVFSNDRNAFSRALKVLDGRAPSLSMGKSPMLARRPHRDSFLFMAAAGLDEIEDLEPASEILRLSKGITIDMGETDGEFNCRATVTAKSEEVAGDIVSVIDGVVALGRLVAAHDPDARPLKLLTDAVRVRSDEDQIVVRFRCDSRRLLEEIEAIDKRRHDNDDDDDGDRRRGRDRDWDDDGDDHDDDDDGDSRRRSRGRRGHKD